MGKDDKFRKDFTAKQYEANLKRKAKNSEAIIDEDDESRNIKSKSKREIS